MLSLFDLKSVFVLATNCADAKPSFEFSGYIISSSEGKGFSVGYCVGCFSVGYGVGGSSGVTSVGYCVGFLSVGCAVGGYGPSVGYCVGFLSVGCAVGGCGSAGVTSGLLSGDTMIVRELYSIG